MHNTHPHFYGAMKLSQASYDYKSFINYMTRRDCGGCRRDWCPPLRIRDVRMQTFSLPPEIPPASAGVCRGPASCIAIGGVGSRRVRIGPQMYARMHSNVRMRTCPWTHPQCVCVRSQKHSRKRPCQHISAALSVPFFFLQCFDTVGWAAGRASGL